MSWKRKVMFGGLGLLALAASSSEFAVRRAEARENYDAWLKEIQTTVTRINDTPSAELKNEYCIPIVENMPQKVAEWQPIVDKIYEEVNPRKPLDKCFIYAMIQAESQGGHYIRGGVLRSSAGAIGAMQLLPSTARRFVKNPFDSEQNIRAGISYLDTIAEYLQENDPTWFGKTRDERLDALSAAYNMGEGGYVAAINRAQKRGTEPRLPKETRGHIEKVRTAYETYGEKTFVDGEI